MYKVKRNAINTLANSLIDILNLKFPIPVEEIPERIGGNLETVPFIGENLEAMISKVNGSFQILITDDKLPQRQRFSIAHELGHLFLHMGYLINDELWHNTNNYNDSVYYRYGHSEEENEANEFAAALLMPEAKFREVAKNSLKSGYYDIDEIADFFDVSPSAVLTRGKWLGLFTWED